MGNTLGSFSKGEIAYVPSNMPHCWIFEDFDAYDDGTIENISIFISPKLLDTLNSFSPEICAVLSKIQHIDKVIVFEDATLIEMQKLMVLMLNQNKIEQFSSLVKLFSLIAANNEKGKIIGSKVTQDRNTRRLQEAHRFVLTNFHKEVNLDEAAKFVGMERSSFSSFFKKMTGQSFFEFLTLYRIESSAQMLLKTSMTVAEISSSVGFNDVPHFNRVFKKIKQTTPTAYRNS